MEYINYIYIYIYIEREREITSPVARSLEPTRYGDDFHIIFFSSYYFF